MAHTPLHEWLRPRLDALLRDAMAAGFERDAAVAVIADLATAPPFDTAPPPAEPEFP
jgi:hypothetical protein